MEAGLINPYETYTKTLAGLPPLPFVKDQSQCNDTGPAFIQELYKDLKD